MRMNARQCFKYLGLRGELYRGNIVVRQRRGKWFIAGREWHYPIEFQTRDEAREQIDKEITEHQRRQEEYLLRYPALVTV